MGSGCEHCPKGGGGCIVCDLLNTPRGEFPAGGTDAANRAAVSGIMPDDPAFTASVLFPDADRLRGRPVPVTVWVSWEWWGVEVAGPVADCLEYLTRRAAGSGSPRADVAAAAAM